MGRLRSTKYLPNLFLQKGTDTFCVFSHFTQPNLTFYHLQPDERKEAKEEDLAVVAGGHV